MTHLHVWQIRGIPHHRLRFGWKSEMLSWKNVDRHSCYCIVNQEFVSLSRDQAAGVTWHIHMSQAWQTWHIHMSRVWYDTFICCRRDLTHSYVAGLTWHIHTSWVWHDTFICRKRDMTHSYLASVTWLIHTSRVWHDTFIVHSLVPSLVSVHSLKRSSRRHDMRDSYVAWHNTHECLIWAIQMWHQTYVRYSNVIWDIHTSHGMTHKNISYETFVCEPFKCDMRHIWDIQMWYETFICHKTWYIWISHMRYL